MKSYFLTFTGLLILFTGVLTNKVYGQCTVGQPNISVQAEAFSSITIVEGTSTTLTSPVAGTTYQWTLDGINISGATSATYTIHSFANSDIGDYNVIVDSAILPNGVSLSIFNADVSDYDRDRQALIDFYNSTDGASWTNNTNWLTGPIETWEGVRVENCRVTELRLSGNNISGTIPSSFKNLTGLKRLSIRNNTISGILDITEMPSLLHLYVSNNNLTDIRFGNNNLLQRVHIQDNPFVSGKTIDISAMRGLIDFRAARLNLGGLTVSGDYNRLLYFIISENQIPGTLDISRMPNLILCYAHDNQFTNFNIGIGEALSRFYFYNNPVAAGKTMDISGMRKLLDFRVQGLGLNQLIMSGTYDEMLYFIIRDNQIGGTLDISMMPKLRLCYAFNNQFTDFRLGSHPELGRFYFYNNPVVPGKTMDISSMRKLLDFRVQGLGLSELIMSGSYDEMLYFIVKDNQIGGTLDISMMPKVILCNAENNFYDDLILPSNVTGADRTLTHLHIRNNNLHFDDLLPYSTIFDSFNFSYNRQRTVPTLVSGSTVSVLVGGGIDYIWTPSASNTSSVVVTASDTYSCEVRNASVPGLVIKSDPVFVTASSSRRSNHTAKTTKRLANSDDMMQVFPNPISVGEPIKVALDMGENQNAHINIYTIQGKKVINQVIDRKEKNSLYSIHSDGLVPGIYIISMEMGSKKINQKIIVK